MRTIQTNKKFIEDYMRENSISLNKLATDMGVSPGSLSRILNGERNAGASFVAAALSYFGVKFETLFYFHKSLTKVNEEGEQHEH